MDINLVILFFLLAFVSEIIGTVSGFTSSVFFVPLAGMMFDFETTLVLTGILYIFSAASKVYLFRQSIDWKVTLKIGLPSVLMVLVSAQLNNVLDVKYAELAMGIFLITFAVLFFLKKNLRFKPTLQNAIGSGAVAGFLSGLIGISGPIRAAALTAFGLKKDMFMGTSAAIDFPLDLVRTSVYIANGYLAARFLWFIPFLLVAAYAGSFIGKLLLDKIPETIFKRYILALIFVMGVILLYGFFASKEILK